MAIRGHRADGWWVAAAGLLGAATLAWRGLDRAAFRDPAAAWPWIGGDSWDWIAAGLVLRGVPIEAGERPPLLPLLTAIADWFGWLAAPGLLGLVAVAIVPLVVWWAAARRTSRVAAGGAALALIVNQSWLRCGIEWMADVPAGVLMAAALVALVGDRSRPRWRTAGALLGLATATSQVAVVLLVVWGWVWRVRRPVDLERRRALLGTAFAVLPMLVWSGWKFLQFGTAGDVGVSHWRFLRFDPSGIAPFAWQLLSAWGWPAVALTLVGMIRIVRHARARTGAGIDLVWIAAPLLVGGFFAVLYAYDAPRFAVMVLPLLAVPLAVGLDALRPVSVRILASGAVVAGAVAPLPDFELTGAAVPLVPGVRLVAPLEWRFDGSLAPRPVEARLEVAASTWNDLAWLEVGRRLEGQRTVPLAPRPWPLPAGVLVLDDDASSRYADLCRWSILARAPTGSLPASAARWLCPQAEVIEHAGFGVQALISPVDGHTWWVALPTGREQAEWCRATLSAAGRGRAQAVLAAAAGRHLLVGPDDDDWWVWLALLDPSERLHVRTGFDPAEVAAAATGPQRQLEGLQTLPIAVLGRQGLAVWRDQGTAGSTEKIVTVPETS